WLQPVGRAGRRRHPCTSAGTAARYAYELFKRRDWEANAMNQRSIISTFNQAIALVGSLLACTLFMTSAVGAAEPNKAALIRDALGAAPPSIAKTATVMDWDHTVLRKGAGPYVCHPTPPDLRAKGGREPMCVDEVWEKWADAWQNKKPFKAGRVGIAYMLAGDTGASNTDPYATKASADNQWVAEGPHIMVLVPDAEQLEGVSNDPNNGGAYVMWKGTPYAHIMVPVAARPAGQR